MRYETVACDLCGSRAQAPLFSGRDSLGISCAEFTVVRCRSCGLIFLNPRPAEEALPGFYPDAYGAYADDQVEREEVFSSGTGAGVEFKNRVKRQILREFYGYPCGGFRATLRERLAAWAWYPEFRRRFPALLSYRPDGAMLDIGCGRAGYLALMKKLGWTVQGVELNRSCCEYAVEKLGVPVFCGDPLGSSLPGGSFDVVRMSHFLEHHPRPSAVLAECRRLMKDDGLLVIGVPNAASFEAGVLKGKSVLFDTPRHLYDFTPATLSAMLRKAGLRSVRTVFGLSLSSFDMSVNNCLKERGSRLRLSTDLRMTPLGWMFDSFLSLARRASVFTVYAEKAPGGRP